MGGNKHVYMFILIDLPFPKKIKKLGGRHDCMCDELFVVTTTVLNCFWYRDIYRERIDF